jgi:hypothetical protein
VAIYENMYVAFTKSVLPDISSNQCSVIYNSIIINLKKACLEKYSVTDEVRCNPGPAVHAGECEGLGRPLQQVRGGGQPF